MNVLVFLVSWFLASIPIGLVVGRIFARSNRASDLQLVIASGKPTRLERISYVDEASYVHSMISSSGD